MSYYHLKNIARNIEADPKYEFNFPWGRVKKVGGTVIVSRPGHSDRSFFTSESVIRFISQI